MNAFCQLAAILNKGDKAVLLTLIKEQGLTRGLAGRKVIYDFYGNIMSSELPDNLTGLVAPCVSDFIKGKAQAVTEVLQADEGSYEVYMEKYIPAPKALIFGAGHVSQPTSHLLKTIGFNVTVIDDRISFANRERFPDADEIIVDSFEKVAQDIEVDANTWVILLTRGHHHDFVCLEKLIDKPAAYFGMIGSRRRAATIREQLLEAGKPREKVDKLYCPIGLNIGAETPEELAVSIVSQIIAVKYNKEAGV
ncbi:MAG: XdhC family protein [Bacillota bacterium]